MMDLYVSNPATIPYPKSSIIYKTNPRTISHEDRNFTYYGKVHLANSACNQFLNILKLSALALASLLLIPLCFASYRKLICKTLNHIQHDIVKIYLLEKQEDKKDNLEFVNVEPSILLPAQLENEKKEEKSELVEIVEEAIIDEPDVPLEEIEPVKSLNPINPIVEEIEETAPQKLEIKPAEIIKAFNETEDVSARALLLSQYALLDLDTLVLVENLSSQIKHEIFLQTVKLLKAQNSEKTEPIAILFIKDLLAYEMHREIWFLFKVVYGEEEHYEKALEILKNFSKDLLRAKEYEKAISLVKTHHIPNVFEEVAVDHLNKEEWSDCLKILLLSKPKNLFNKTVSLMAAKLTDHFIASKDLEKANQAFLYIACEETDSPFLINSSKTK